MARYGHLLLILLLGFWLPSCRVTNLYQTWSDNLLEMVSLESGRPHSVDDVSMMLGAPPVRREIVKDPPYFSTGWQWSRRDSRGPVTVTHVMPRSSAAAAGLKRGDVVLAVDGHPTATAADMEDFAEANPLLAAGVQRILLTSRGEIVVLSEERSVEQCYWDISGGAISSGSSGAFFNRYGGAASGRSWSYDRYFRTTCRFVDGILISCQSNWQM